MAPHLLSATWDHPKVGSNMPQGGFPLPSSVTSVTKPPFWAPRQNPVRDHQGVDRSGALHPASLQKRPFPRLPERLNTLSNRVSKRKKHRVSGVLCNLGKHISGERRQSVAVLEGPTSLRTLSVDAGYRYSKPAAIRSCRSCPPHRCCSSDARTAHTVCPPASETWWGCFR
jgi:hypothetical protein